MLNKIDYINLYRIVQLAKAEGLEQCQILVALAAKLQATVKELETAEKAPVPKTEE